MRHVGSQLPDQGSNTYLQHWRAKPQPLDCQESSWCSLLNTPAKSNAKYVRWEIDETKLAKWCWVSSLLDTWGFIIVFSFLWSMFENVHQRCFRGLWKVGNKIKTNANILANAWRCPLGILQIRLNSFTYSFNTRFLSLQCTGAVIQSGWDTVPASEISSSCREAGRRIVTANLQSSWYADENKLQCRHKGCNETIWRKPTLAAGFLTKEKQRK